MKTYLALSLVALSGLVGLAVLSRKIDRLQQQIERLEHRTKDAATKTRVQELEQQIVLEREVAPPRVERVVEPREEAAATGGITEEQIQQLVDRRVEERLKKEPQDNGWGGKKLPLQTIAEDLKLDPATQSAMADVVNTAKQEAFDLLRTARSDGSSLADEILAAFTQGDNPQEAGQKAFMKIFTEKVPGTDETFLQGILRIQERAHEGLKRILPPDQYMRYRHTGVEPLDIETGFDPWAEYFRTK